MFFFTNKPSEAEETTHQKQWKLNRKKNQETKNFLEKELKP